MTHATGIRRAVPDDLDTLIELHRQFCELDRHPFTEPRVRAAFIPLLEGDEHGVVWIIDEPAAYAILTWGWSIEAGGFEAVLDEIYASQRNAGLGAALIEHVVADARARGIARIFLETEAHNERGRRLYARHGFVEDDSIWMSLEFTDLS
jgi:GNAT superfamily N-acetyltransferase